MIPSSGSKSLGSSIEGIESSSGNYYPLIDSSISESPLHEKQEEGGDRGKFVSTCLFDETSLTTRTLWRWSNEEICSFVLTFVTEVARHSFLPRWSRWRKRREGETSGGGESRVGKDLYFPTSKSKVSRTEVSSSSQVLFTKRKGSMKKQKREWRRSKAEFSCAMDCKWIVASQGFLNRLLLLQATCRRPLLSCTQVERVPERERECEEVSPVSPNLFDRLGLRFPPLSCRVDFPLLREISSTFLRHASQTNAQLGNSAGKQGFWGVVLTILSRGRMGKFASLLIWLRGGDSDRVFLLLLCARSFVVVREGGEGASDSNLVRFFLSPPPCRSPFNSLA